MNPWFAKVAVLLGCVVMVAIRAPHGQRSRSVKVVKNRKGALETFLLTLAWLGYFLPLIWVMSPALALADYELSSVPFVAGVVLITVGLWYFHRSHADLGTNWSITLEVRERHQLITDGVYRSVRHPMYSALLLYSLGQAILLPNWIAGPSYLAAMTLLFACRVGPEERMMHEEFGDEYAAYCTRTKRLVPRVW